MELKAYMNNKYTELSKQGGYPFTWYEEVYKQFSNLTNDGRKIYPFTKTGFYEFINEYASHSKTTKRQIRDCLGLLKWSRENKMNVIRYPGWCICFSKFKDQNNKNSVITLYTNELSIFWNEFMQDCVKYNIDTSKIKSTDINCFLKKWIENTEMMYQKEKQKSPIISKHTIDITESNDDHFKQPSLKKKKIVKENKEEKEQQEKKNNIEDIVYLNSPIHYKFSKILKETNNNSLDELIQLHHDITKRIVIQTLKIEDENIKKLLKEPIEDYFSKLFLESIKRGTVESLIKK